MTNISSRAVQRVFLVGCSRSGTTLLQSLIATHPEIASFPETDFFSGIVRWPARSWRLNFRLATGAEREFVIRYLERVGRRDIARKLPPQPLRLSSAVNAYLFALDQMAGNANASIWVEKTPLHVLHLKRIGRYVPGAKVIHLIRDGRDVVASLYDRAMKYPNVFGHQKDLRECVSLWNRCLEASRKCVERNGHHLVFFGALTQGVHEELDRIGTFLDVEFTTAMLTKHAGVAEDLILADEEWKDDVRKPVGRNTSKFERLFGPSIQEELSSALNLQLYHELRTVSEGRHRCGE